MTHPRSVSERTLVVMRHAKAEPDGPTDFDRPLAPRGHRDARAAGAWLAAAGVRPSHALVSAALRTHQTWEDVALGAGWDLEPDLDRGLYAAGPESALDLLRLTPEDATTLVVVGHNPTMAMLVALLEDGSDPALAAAALPAGHFPTSALAVLHLPGSWAALEPGTARLGAAHVARG